MIPRSGLATVAFYGDHIAIRKLVDCSETTDAAIKLVLTMAWALLSILPFIPWAGPGHSETPLGECSIGDVPSLHGGPRSRAIVSSASPRCPNFGP